MATPLPAAPPTVTSLPAAPPSARVKTARISLGRVVRAESSTYFMLLGTTLFLVLFGLVMVLSSSSVTSFTDSQGFFGVFWRQGLFAMIGVPLMLVISRLPVRFWRKFAWVPLVVGIVLQGLVAFTDLGVDVGGNKNWLAIAGFNFQPSELIKLGLVAWLAVILSKKEPYLGRWGHALIPAIPVAGIGLALVMAGKDLGTAMIMAGIIFGALFFAGIKLRMLFVLGLAGGVATLLFAVLSANRLDRIQSFLGIGPGSASDDYSGTAWQSTHGQWALADGGVFGVGLGNSKAKWSWLPAADNDFIFAIIGEELGLLGAIVVLGLFVALAIAFLRLIRKSKDLFSRVITGSVMVWLIGQAFVNIAVVLGVLPVLGVPLPLISSGGSALITTMVAIGLVLSIAKSSEAGGDEREALSASARSGARR